MGHVAIRAREASRYNRHRVCIVRTRTTLETLLPVLVFTTIRPYAHGVRGTPYTIWSTRGVSACYTLDHGIISLCLSQKVKGQKRSAARETHIPLLCSDGGVVE